MRDTCHLRDALSGLGAPVAVVDLAALEHNATDLLRRSPLPVRLASKSIRVRSLLERLLARDGFTGVLAYSAAEARWLVGHGVRDVLVAYPTVDAATARAVSADPVAAEQVTFVVDSPEHLDLLAAQALDRPLRVCLDVDCSLRVGPVHVGAHRSGLRTPADAARMAREVAARPGLRLTALMFYDAQVAGVPDTGAHVRAMKALSWRDLERRRAAVRRAVEQHARLEVVNAGGTGSLHRFADDGVVTDLAAGSGLFAPTLFDGYRGTRLRPAAWFVSPVVRKPREDVVVTFAGGYLASGPPGTSRAPVVSHPQGLRPFAAEGFGEVQTPLHGPAARSLRIGDPVWFRHAKAGELCERVDEVLLLERDGSLTRVPTYRGEGMCCG